MTTKAKPKNSAKPKNRTARAGVPLAVQAMEGTFAPKRIASSALHEQLSYRAAGNPPNNQQKQNDCYPLSFRECE